MRLFVLLLVLMLPAAAQEFVGGMDFLTDYEVDLLREAQEPKPRIAAYVQFATLRLELIDQLLAKEEAGRGAQVHKNLEEYGRVIEAIDTTIDDALARNLNMEDALEGLIESEEKFAARLEKLAAAPPEDHWRYEFVLEDAIEMTRDSIELSAEDLGDRKRVVISKDRRDQEKAEESMTAARKKEADKAHAKERAETKARGKRPTLLKPGEKLGGAK